MPRRLQTSIWAEENHHAGWRGGGERKAVRLWGQEMALLCVEKMKSSTFVATMGEGMWRRLPVSSRTVRIVGRVLLRLCIYFVRVAAQEPLLHCIARADAVSVRCSLCEVVKLNSDGLRESILQHDRHGPSTMGLIIPKLLCPSTLRLSGLISCSYLLWLYRKAFESFDP